MPKASLHLPGRVHQGFASIVASIWPALRSALSSLLSGTQGYHDSYHSYDRGSRGIRNIYVSGHSLGAGVATLIAYTMQVSRASGYSSLSSSLMMLSIGEHQTCCRCQLFMVKHRQHHAV